MACPPSGSGLGSPARHGRADPPGTATADHAGLPVALTGASCGPRSRRRGSSACMQRLHGRYAAAQCRHFAGQRVAHLLTEYRQAAQCRVASLRRVPRGDCPARPGEHVGIIETSHSRLPWAKADVCGTSGGQRESEAKEGRAASQAASGEFWRTAASSSTVGATGQARTPGSGRAGPRHVVRSPTVGLR